MFAHRKPDVLVVGAGPVGLFTALALNQRGIRVQIVDREPRTGSQSYALALHAESLRLLEGAGILGPVLDAAHRVRRVGLYDGRARRAELRISDLAEDHSFLAVLPQDELEEKLEAALAQRGVKVEWSHEVSALAHRDDHVEVGIDRLSLDTLGYSVQHSEWVVASKRRHELPFVVGADGHASVVRRRMAIDFPAVAPPSDFAVFEFRTDARLGDEMALVFDERTTSVCWPLPGGFCRWSFELPSWADDGWDSRRKERELVQIEAERDPELTEARLQQLLAERAPWFRGSIGGIRWRKTVRFERRLAGSFGSGRVWLCGDAAHLTGPAGIQSMNIGFREAVQLADALAEARRNGGAAGSLAGYDAARRGEWRGLLGLDALLRPGPQTEPWVATLAGRLLSCIPAAGNDLARLAAQLGLVCQLPAAASVCAGRVAAS